MNLSATAIATLTSIAALATEHGAAVKTSTLSAPGYEIKQLYGTIPSLVKKGLVVKSEIDKVRYINLTEAGYAVLNGMDPAEFMNATETPVVETSPVVEVVSEVVEPVVEPVKVEKVKTEKVSKPKKAKMAKPADEELIELDDDFVFNEFSY